MSQEEERIKTIAGYLLKNNARLILHASPEVATFVKAAILQAYANADAVLRTTTGQVVVAYLGVLEPRNWPEVLQLLVNRLDDPELDRQEVGYHCFELCRDLRPL